MNFQREQPSPCSFTFNALILKSGRTIVLDFQSSAHFPEFVQFAFINDYSKGHLGFCIINPNVPETSLRSSGEDRCPHSQLRSWGWTRNSPLFRLISSWQEVGAYPRPWFHSFELDLQQPSASTQQKIGFKVLKNAFKRNKTVY